MEGLPTFKLLTLTLNWGHTAYRHASLIDLYIHAKFHWNRKHVLWMDGHLRSALLKF